jgi:small subunit ribosomal protein S3
VIKKFLKKKLYQAGISKIEIERAANKDKRAKINIHTSRPGLVIGRKGAEVENLSANCRGSRTRRSSSISPR